MPRFNYDFNKLTSAEDKVYKFLEANLDRSVTVEEIALELWGHYQAGYHDPIVQVFICNIRKKLKYRFEIQRKTAYSITPKIAKQLERAAK